MGGREWALDKFNSLASSSPTESDKKLAKWLVDDAGHYNNVAGVMADHAIKWRDASLWERVAKKARYQVSFLGHQNLLDALRVFAFDTVRPW